MAGEVGAAGEVRSILRDDGPGVVVHGHGDLGLEQAERFECVVGAHGEVVADGQQREVEPDAADELQVEEQRGVAGVVDALAVGGDEQAGGDAEVDGLQAGLDARAVMRGVSFKRPKGKLAPPPTPSPWVLAPSAAKYSASS